MRRRLGVSDRFEAGLDARAELAGEGFVYGGGGPHASRCDRGLASQKLHGFGRFASEYPSVPVIGEELSAACALSDLSHQLLEAAADRIGSLEGHRVNVHG
jgi:uncharacterized protein DUF1876